MQNGASISRGLAATGAAALIAVAATALGDDDEHVFALTNQLYSDECGSCHVAYPPQLLPARTWRSIMTGLGEHFGVDASVDAGSAQALLAYLEANAGADRAGDGGSMRVTDTRWFRHEHDELPRAVWQAPEVQSAANCPACHIDAERGDYSERTLRVPR